MATLPRTLQRPTSADLGLPALTRHLRPLASFFLHGFVCHSRTAVEDDITSHLVRLVFPNVGVLSTMELSGTLLPSAVVMWVSSDDTALLCGAYIRVTAAHARAIWTRNETLWYSSTHTARGHAALRIKARACGVVDSCNFLPSDDTFCLES